MNEEQVIERVRVAVDARVSGVPSTPPPMGEPSYSAEPAPRRARWILPAALAAAAAIALGVVIVTRGDDDRGNVDVPSSTVAAPPLGFERWVLDAPGAELTAAEDATTNSTAVGTTVYYATTYGRSRAAVRTNGQSALLESGPWNETRPLTVQGATATEYIDSDGPFDLLVVNTEPPVIVETFGLLATEDMASRLRLVDGVWELDTTDLDGLAEVGRRSEADGPLRYSFLQYRYAGADVSITVVDHPGGIAGFLLDGGSTAELEAPAGGTLVYSSEVTQKFVAGSSTGDVVQIGAPVELMDDVISNLRLVDDSTWRDLVSRVRPDLSPEKYRAVGTVIEVPGQGVTLCLGAVRESLPPQCDGIPVDPVAWRWPDGMFQESDGARWGEFVVIGTYDGTIFTSTEMPRLATSTDRRTVVKGSTATRCEEPAGGWHAAAENSPTGMDSESTLAEVSAYDDSQPDFGGMWIDDSITLPTDRGARYVLNVMFTADVDRHRAALDEIWPGALCVLQTTTPAVTDLIQIRNQVAQMPGELTSLIDDPNGRVLALFVLATPELQADLDARYGPGVVIATSALVPVP